MKARYIPNTIVSKGAQEAGWLFGHPVLRSAGVSQAYWAKSTISPYAQKGGGWSALLNGGVQTGANFAACFIPVNELPVTQFDTAQWAYYMTAAETMGVNIVIWIHDPTDYDKRAEVTQLGSSVEKALGWDACEFTTATTGMFFYGENTTGTGLTAGTQYAWSQFQTDTLFKDWTIYRISFEYGWEASGTFDPTWLAEVKLNGLPIRFEPTEEDLQIPVFQYSTGAVALATVLAPKTPFQLVRIDLHLSAAATQQTFTATLDAGRVATVYDTLLISKAMSGVTDYVVNFGDGYDFMEDDEIDCAWTNTDTKTYGLTYVFRSLP